MKKILLIALFISVGFSQRLNEFIETYENGNIKSITSHKETRNRIEKVEYVEYYENGNKKEEATYKDGQKDGLLTRWHENGQKSKEGTYKDGLPDGSWNGWYDNGQKEFEGTYKGKKAISEKVWNKDGSVKE